MIVVARGLGFHFIAQMIRILRNEEHRLSACATVAGCQLALRPLEFIPLEQIGRQGSEG
jgi:hypothetical protein